VTEQQAFLACFGMNAHHGMLTFDDLRGILPAIFFGNVIVEQFHPARGVVEIVAMHRPQLFSQRFERVWQAVVCGDRVRPDGVAPQAGQRDRAKNGQLGRNGSVT
jgi:hypothetical protein